jgi:beta-exotoxin I transport system permease protein
VSGPVFRQTLRQAGRTIAILSVASGAFYYLILLASHSFLNGQTSIEFFRHPPKAIEAFLGGSANFLSPSGWLAAGMTHPVTLALMTAAAMVVASGSVASEVERGTIDLVLSRPVGRTRFLLAKAVASIVAVTAAEAGGLVGVLLARASISHIDEISISSILSAFLASWILFVALSMIGVLASSVSSLRSRALGLAVGAVVGWFFLNFIALLIDGVSGMRFVSPFHYFSPGTILAGTAEGWDLAVLAGLAAVSLVAATWWFDRRDLAR